MVGWIIVILVILYIVGHATLSGRSSNGEEKSYGFDDQDPNNLLYEEMQEEFFDEVKNP